MILCPPLYMVINRQRKSSMLRHQRTIRGLMLEVISSAQGCFNHPRTSHVRHLYLTQVRVFLGHMGMRVSRLCKSLESSDVNEARLECSPCDISNTERSTSLNSLKYCILFFTFHVAMVNHKYFVFIVGKCLLSQFGFFYQLFENISYIPCLINTKTCYCVILAFGFI